MAKKSTTGKSITGKTRTKTSERAKRIVEDRVDIRSRMHALVRDSLAAGELGASDVRAAVKDAFTGVRAGLAKAVPADHKNVLHEAFDGMSDAIAASAESARRAVAHAKTATQRMTDNELKPLASTVKKLEADFLSAVSDAARGMSAESSKYLDELVRRTKKAGTKLAPATRDALSTAAHRAPDLAVETMKASGRAAAGVASEVAMGISGLLSGFGAALRSASSGRTVSKKVPAGKAASAKSPGAKPASRTSAKKSSPSRTSAKTSARTTAKKSAKR
ncbi:MAG: DUF6781 family protein [Phycisphaerae bacterium]|nr:DUF6781 family protein [Phycisphaerae bacterium]